MARFGKCQTCNREFVIPDKRRGRFPRFCSHSCKIEWNRTVYRPKSRHAYKQRRLDANLHWTDGRTPHVFSCVECGRLFESHQVKAVCCSDECTRARTKRAHSAYVATLTRKYASKADRDRFYGYLRRSRVADRESETFAADEIFQRDRWVCGLCGKKVLRNLQWPDKRSASLDHIQPISEGGKHVRANVQCAHLECNSRKGRGAGGQLRMFG